MSKEGPEFDALVAEIKNVTRSVGEQLSTKAARRAARAVLGGMSKAEAISAEINRW